MLGIKARYEANVRKICSVWNQKAKMFKLGCRKIPKISRPKICVLKYVKN